MEKSAVCFVRWSALLFSLFFVCATAAIAQNRFPGDIAFVNRDAQVRKYANDASEVVSKPNIHWVVVINWTKDDEWAYVAVSDLELGYVRRRDIVLSGMRNEPFQKAPPVNRVAFRALSAHHYSSKISESPIAYISKIFALEGLELSSKPETQVNQGKKVERIKNASIGDLVYFKNLKDAVGIFLSDTKVLVIKKSGSYVQASGEKAFQRTVRAIRRIS